ncbi:MAG TPA: phosphate ABC transporter ATP-binding protein PstB [Gemmatimonadales bacterium]|nr:phosphate ABC transporter ATP-binding protein PstB [Gemmatimonadales bacterium]
MVDPRPHIATERLTALYGNVPAVKDVTIAFKPNTVSALIGPSGCGKSTFLRSLNRMHELTEGGWITGQVLLDNHDVYSARVNPTELRRRVGMVFQKAAPFPTMSIAENVSAGPRLTGLVRKRDIPDLVQRCLRQAALWDEVKDRLDQPATALSGGQQQRLCIARTLANQPEVLLLDEPCSALDPISTQKIEELLLEIKKDYTIILVTHNLQQAARASDFTAFFDAGRLVEFGETRRLFTTPVEERTEAYITGRFG